MSLIDNVIETVRSMGCDYWAAYEKNQNLNDIPEPMSLPNNDILILLYKASRRFVMIC